MHLHRLSCLLVLLLAGGLAACQSSRPAGSDVTAAQRAAMEAELTRLMTESAAAWNRADLDGHVALYVEESTFMTGRGPVGGIATIRDILNRGFWQDGKPIQQLRFEELVTRPLGPDHALMTGRFVLSGGGREDATGRFSLTWRRTPDGWHILHDHSG
jgi:ketosteroid isomerase-like protein